MIKEVVDLLGKKAKDKITGATGIITTVCFDLYGCIQVVIQPDKLGKDGQHLSNHGWIDVNRIVVLKDKKIMTPPDFNKSYAAFNDVHGAAEKPGV